MRIPDVLTFMRAAVRRDSLCCETVGAWLEAHGVRHCHDRAMMLRAWRRGIMRSATLAFGFIGLPEIGGGCARDGDVVLVMQEDGSQILGLCWRGRAVCAAGGRVAVLETPFLTAWRFEVARQTIARESAGAAPAHATRG